MDDEIPILEVLDMALAYLDEGLSLAEVARRFGQDYGLVVKSFMDWKVPTRRDEGSWAPVTPKVPRRREGEKLADYKERRAAWDWMQDVAPTMRRSLFFFEPEPKSAQRGDLYTSGDLYERGIRRGETMTGLMARRRVQRGGWHPGVRSDLRGAGLVVRGAGPIVMVGKTWH